MLRHIKCEKDKQESEFEVSSAMSKDYIIYIVLIHFVSALKKQIDTMVLEIGDIKRQNSLIKREIEEMHRQISANHSFITT